LAVDEKHPVFSERRSDSDELNCLRQVVYSKDKSKSLLADMTGIDLLLRKSLEWSHEEEWRIVKTLDSASAMAWMPDHSVYLYSLPPSAIQGVIFGAHISDEARRRVQNALYASRAYDHVWQKQAEVAPGKFALNFFRMPPRATVCSSPNASLHVSDVDPETSNDLRNLIEAGVAAGVHQPFDLSRLKNIYISADIRKTIAGLLGSERQYGSEGAQVLATPAGAEADVHVFMRAGLFSLWSVASAEEQRQMVHLLHRQMARVHNITMRYRVFGEKVLTTTPPGANGYLAPVALEIWNDYVVPRLSASSMQQANLLNLVTNIASLRTECSSAVASEISSYRKHSDLNILMIAVAKRVQAFLCGIAEAIGYADGGDPVLTDSIVEGVKAAAGKDYARIVTDLIVTLRRMYRYYPVWEEFSMYDDVMFAFRALAFQWGIALRDLGDGRVHIAVP
jgi:hypothetical protein